MPHNNVVSSAVFSPDGKYVVSGSADKTARVWETNTGREITRVIHNDNVVVVTFSPDGKFVASGGEDGVIRIWTWRPDDLILDSCIRLPRNLTRAEWQQYIGDALPYQAICPNLPIEPEPTPTPTP